MGNTPISLGNPLHYYFSRHPMLNTMGYFISGFVLLLYGWVFGWLLMPTHTHEPIMD